MPPRRRPPKGKGTTPSSRVHKITSRDQWNSMMQKAGHKKLVFVQFYQSHVWTCKQMRPFFVKFSIQPKFRGAIFAEIDVDEMEDLARSLGISRIPAYRCFWEGQSIDSYEGGAPEQLSEFISRNVNDRSSGGGPFGTVLKLVAVAAAVAGGALIVSKLNHSNKDIKSTGDAHDSKDAILDLKKRILTAQGRLRALEKANRGKQARAQRKLIEQLTAQCRVLERRGDSSAKTTKGAAKGGGLPIHALAPDIAATSDSLDLSKGSRAPILTDLETISRLKWRKRRGEVLYSDEEEVLRSEPLPDVA